MSEEDYPFDRYVPELDRDPMFWIARQMFMLGDPLAPMRALISADLFGEPPPPWVTKYLAERFSRYLDQDNPLPLDKVMGLSGFSGQSPALKAERRKHWEYTCIHHLWELHIALGITIVEASKHVERWAIRSPHRRRYGLEVFTATTLRYKYYHGFKKAIEEGTDAAFGLDYTIQGIKSRKEKIAKEFGIDLM